MSTSWAPSSGPRPSAKERERVAGRLRGACADERLSLETFVTRLDSAYSTRSKAELLLLVADLPAPGWPNRVFLQAVSSLSRWSHQLGVAWREPRTARLMLPTGDRTVVGRSRACTCVISDATVSRTHALLTHIDGRWWLEDCQSRNGTYLNDSRVVSETEVRPGDVIALGAVRFALCAPAGLSQSVA
jgi:FHA domain/Domain of unknown function (DUF1707)